MSGIYFHIPFCHKACNYCDFHFSTTFAKYKGELLNCISHEIQLRNKELTSPIRSIYFGGGTPSILSATEINNILKQCKRFFQFSDDVEITIEANPEDISFEKSLKLVNVGVNRLSIGIQSFQDNVLKWMHRSHNSETAIKCIEDAQRAGISNISLDLIYGLPKHLKRNLKKDINRLIELNVQHISAYNLTVEDRTMLSNWVKKKRYIMPEEEVCSSEYELVLKTLQTAGYQQYEISNFSKKGYRSRHNTSYWRMTPYLGIGPSAHSYDGKRTRKWNISNNQQYIKMIKEDDFKIKKELLSDVDLANELILLGSRTTFGVPINKVLSYLNQKQKSMFLEQLDLLKVKNFIFIKEEHFFVNDKKRFLSDYIARELIILS